MRFSILRPIAAALAALFLATSCIDVNKSLGSEDIPDDYVMRLSTETIALPLQTKIADSLQALSQSNGYIGSVRTPEFGLADFSFGTNFCPYLTKDDYGKDQIIKKVYIVFSGMSTTVADETQAGIMQKFRVYRMTRAIDDKHLYNNELKDEDYIRTSIDSGGVFYTGTDSLTIRLRNSFGKELLKATKLERDSSSRFVERYKGLLFTCDAPAAGTFGGRVTEVPAGSAMLYLVMNFQPTWKEGLARKDTTITYILSPEYTQSFSTYESKSLESAEEQEYLPIEGIGGLKPYIDPLELKDRLDAWVASKGLDPKKIIVGKASFYLPFDNPEPLNKLSAYYPANLFPTHRVISAGSDKDDVETRYYYPIQDIYSSNNNTGTLNRSLGCYYGDFSSYIQNLIGKEKAEIAADQSYKVWFMLSNATVNQSYYSQQTSQSYSTNVATYCVGRINGPLHERAPYMTITYTVLND